MMSGAPSMRRRISPCTATPAAAAPIGTTTSATQNGSLNPITMDTVESAATARKSPWAKLMTRITPKIRFRPHAISAYTPPSRMPPISSSVSGIGRAPSRRLAQEGHAHRADELRARRPEVCLEARAHGRGEGLGQHMLGMRRAHDALDEIIVVAEGEWRHEFTLRGALEDARGDGGAERR